MAKTIYTSKYQNEMIELQGVTTIVQFVDDDDKQNQLDKINEILSRRLAAAGDDMRLTKFFETRAKNMLVNLDAAKSARETLEVVLKSANVSMSGYYRYRDVYDILKNKSVTLDFNNIESEVLDLTLTSLEKNHVIAPKIAAIYKKLSGSEDNDDLL